MLGAVHALKAQGHDTALTRCWPMSRNDLMTQLRSAAVVGILCNWLVRAAT